MVGWRCCMTGSEVMMHETGGDMTNTGKNER